MAPKGQRAARRTDSLSKALIVRSATEILDAHGETGLTFRALTRALNTGYGAIYHHVANKSDLVAAATDEVIAGVVADIDTVGEPRDVLRSLALGLFDAIVAHPWAGAQLTREPWRPTLLDIYETIGQQLLALNVPEERMVDSAGVLVNYIMGVVGQNAANARVLADSNTDRSTLLAGVAAQWTQLDPTRYPSVHKAAAQLSDHDDRAQFLAGVHLILAGIEAELPPDRQDDQLR